MENNLNIKIIPMNKEQFTSFREISCAMYARVSPFYRDIPYATAIEVIKNDFNVRFASEGLITPGQFFLAIMKGAEQVGYFHFSEYPKDTKSLFGWNFHIFENYQKKGLGRLAAALVKAYFKERGYTKMAINVVADNKTAIKIYEEFGFHTTQFNMESQIT